MILVVLENLMRLLCATIISVQFGPSGVTGLSVAQLVGEEFKFELESVFFLTRELMDVSEARRSQENAIQMFVLFGQIGRTGLSAPQHVEGGPDLKCVNVLFLM